MSALRQLGPFQAIHAEVIGEALADADIRFEVIPIDHPVGFYLVRPPGQIHVAVDEARADEAEAILRHLADESEAAAVREAESTPAAADREKAPERRFPLGVAVAIALLLLIGLYLAHLRN